jgi:hypothetical protein
LLLPTMTLWVNCVGIPMSAFFHIAMAYAILRHDGVDVGKMDFLGPINLIDA